MKYNVRDGFLYYIELIEKENYLALFSSKETFEFLEEIDEEKANYSYQPKKWSIKQLIGHITDHERIMIYRILRFSRKDTTTLSSYDENLLVNNSQFHKLSYKHLVIDFKNVRNATNSFISTLSNAQLLLTGMVWNHELTVEDFLKATIGHEQHHLKIIKERYLI
jgi:uncharacterized damage-inducible protein DinB